MIAQNKPYPMMYVYTILKVNTASWLISCRILEYMNILLNIIIMETTKNVLEYIDTQLAKIETEAIEIEVEKLKIGYLKQRNNVERLQIDREKLALKIKEIV